MKLALLLLIPCIASARVGEKYSDFTKRVNVPPSYERTHKNGLIEATYRVNDIIVMLQIVDGTISTETYGNVTKEQAEGLIAKLAKDVAPKKVGDQLVWSVPRRFRAAFYENILEVTDGRSSELLAEVKKEEAEQKARESAKRLAPL
jgi:hypothetical protein